jgi:hypothetical protein
MRKYLVLISIVLCILITKDCISQWQSDVRLTNNSAISYVYSKWCVASNLDFVHVIWYDYRDGNRDIYYKRSTDGGLNWGADTRLTNDSLASQYPSVSVSGSVVHIVWYDNRDGNYEIYYKRSTDNGSNWGTDTRLTNNSSDSYHPCVSASGSNVHIVWYDNRDGNREIYYKNSTNNGSSWGADIRLTNNSSDSWYPLLSVFGSAVHVVWYDVRDGNSEIYYKRSTDGGSTWGADTRLTNDVASSTGASVSASSLGVNVVWNDNRDGNNEIYYKRSTDGGSTWGADTRLTNNSLVSFAPIISTSGSGVQVVWYDNRDGNYEIYYKRSMDAGSNWEADTRLTNSTGESEYPSASISGLTVHVVWQDRRDGNYEIYYKRNPNGNVGINNISSEIPKEYKLMQNYPNPFNPETNIKFEIPKSSIVKITVLDIMGKEIESLLNVSLIPGIYEVVFNGSNYASGIYFYKFSANGFSDVKKMIVLK